MKRSRMIAAGLVAALSLAGAACKKEEGPAERAGRALDEAAGKVEDGVKDLSSEDGPLEQAGEAADEAVDKAMEAAKDAKEAIQQD